jgi:hypothetical protein
MRQVSIAALLGVSTVAGLMAPAQAVNISYETVVTSDPASQGGKVLTMPVNLPGTPASGISQSAREFSVPSIDKQNLVFVAKTDQVSLNNAAGDGQVKVNAISLFRLSPTKTDVVDAQMEVIAPDGLISITYDFDLPDISGINIGYIQSRTDDRSGNPDVTLKVNLWQGTARPGKPRTFASCQFGRLDRNTPLGNAVTVGTKLTIAGGMNSCPVVDPSDQVSALTQAIAGSDQLTTLADGTTLNPESGTPLPLDFRNPVAKGPNVLFSDGNLYLSKSGVLSTIVEIGQELPDANGKLKFLFGNDFDVRGIVFAGSGEKTGIYFQSGGNLTTVAKEGDPVPGESRTFKSLQEPKISGGNILFTESLSNGVVPVKNLYVRYGGQITKVIGTNSQIKGKTVASFSTGKRPISGNTIVFAVKFTDGNGSVVKAKLSP